MEISYLLCERRRCIMLCRLWRMWKSQVACQSYLSTFSVNVLETFITLISQQTTSDMYSVLYF